MIQAPGVHLSPAGGCQAGDRRPPRRIVAAGSGSGDEHQYQRAQKEKPHETQAKRHQAIDPPWPCAGYSVSFEADDLERGLVNHDAGRRLGSATQGRQLRMPKDGQRHGDAVSHLCRRNPLLDKHAGEAAARITCSIRLLVISGSIGVIGTPDGYAIGNRREKAMIARPSQANLPRQLHDLSLKAEELPDAVRGALQATLSVAAVDATQEQVLADTSARLGYLPEEARQATLKLLA
jgi:hypothetical protein